MILPNPKRLQIGKNSLGQILLQSTALLTLIALSIANSGAQAAYRVLQGRVDSDGFPTTAASICLGDSGSDHCYTPSDYQPKSPFGLNAKALDIGQYNGRPLTLFTAVFSAGGSGELTTYALLTVKDGDFVNLLPKLQLTNQSEFAVWNLPEFSSLPILVTADFLWDPYHQLGSHHELESHYGPHRYTIRVLLYNSATGLYAEQIHFDTDRTYTGLNNVDAIKVLDPERKHILTRLRRESIHP
jgi:hypothetical protein